MYPRIYLAAFLLLLMSCNLDEHSKQKQPEQASPKTGKLPTVTLVPIQPQSKPESGQYCFVEKVYDKDGATYIDADYVQFLMGDSAIAAAKRKGEAEIVTDDYYIVNDNPKIRPLKLVSDFEYIAIDIDSTQNPKPMVIEYLEAAIKNKGLLILAFNSSGEVVRIKEQYLP